MTEITEAAMTDHHPTADDYRNRAERAEAECAELRKLDGFPLAVALTQAQRRIEALEKHAGEMAEALGDIDRAEFYPGPEWAEFIKAYARKPLANWTAYLLDGR